MGLKNAVNVPVDVDEKTGEINAQPLIDRIKADQQKIGKEKITKPPPKKTWAYEAPKDEQEREKRLLEFEEAVDKSRFTEEEKNAWNVLLSSDEKDFIWEAWKLFVEGDKTLPVYRQNTRCARELVKMMGMNGNFCWVAKKGKEWVGVPQTDRTRDGEIQKWVESIMQDKLKVKAEEGFDVTNFARFCCVRKKDYSDEE